MTTHIPNTTTHLAGMVLKNPVMTASGTFASGKEYGGFFDLNTLGALVCKGVSNEPWPGNPPHRITETASGMLNAIGLQNPGAVAFIADDLQFMKQAVGIDNPVSPTDRTKVIINLCGKTIDDYVAVTQAFQGQGADAYEINISCPNIKEGGMAFGTDPVAAAKVIAAVKQHADKPIIAKLSPNVTDIATIAQAVEAAGADAISMINTLTGMAVDIHQRKPVLSIGSGGLSGPAVKPVALHLTSKVAKAVKIPIIGMGGIATWQDAVAFIMVGATAIAVGTANFYNPQATQEIIAGIEQYLRDNQLTSLDDIRGVI